jgi:NAD(P)-dependent dehydrogenase (short-subunit alcohol dehydrogenase family)
MKAIVTGHSRGLGAAIARSLLERRIPVLGLARSRSQELAEYDAGLLTQVAVDLSDGAALGAWFEGGELQRYLAGSETAILVNNAGVVRPVGTLGQQEPDEVVKAVSLNVTAALALSAAVVRAVPGGHKRILHISSGAGRSAYSGWSVYCATKAALDMHAQAVALDNDPLTRICSLAPGVIDTGMQAEIRGTSDERFPMRQRFVQMKNHGALTPPDVAGRAVVDYLLSARFGNKAVDDLRQV